MVSPGSKKPASAENILGGNIFWRPSKHLSLKIGSMITTGSTRGNNSTLQFLQIFLQPASTVSSRELSHLVQKYWMNSIRPST